jgi:hypothetical protein
MREGRASSRAGSKSKERSGDEQRLKLWCDLVHDIHPVWRWLEAAANTSILI